KAAECSKYCSNHRATAVKLQLSDVFTGFAVRPRKPQHERFIDDLSGSRVTHAPELSLSRLRHATDHRFESESSAWPGNANDRNRGRRPAGGEGIDRGGQVAHRLITAEPRRLQN